MRKKIILNLSISILPFAVKKLHVFIKNIWKCTVLALVCKMYVVLLYFLIHMQKG